MDGQTPEIGIEQPLRELAPQVLGVVARRFRDFTSAEDAAQEALPAVFRQWPKEGIPEGSRGWLIQVANRRMRDIVRSEMARRVRFRTASHRQMQQSVLFCSRFSRYRESCI